MLTSMDMRLPTDNDRELIAAATRTIDAHADADGVHTVGAAVRDAEGQVHVGVNLYHFTGGPCAELVALGSARASGARELTDGIRNVPVADLLPLAFDWVAQVQAASTS
jgi:cytidine deaminase